MSSTINKSDFIKQTAKQTFNEAWKFLDKKKLNKDEKIALLNLVHTSYYLWKQIPECTAVNKSISLWQISRAYAHTGDGANALIFAEQNIKLCKDEKPDGFYTAYAYESAARAYVMLGNHTKATSQIKLALQHIKTSKETHLDDFYKDIALIEKLL
jgi:tetratricopeptide (TPR) repeat protein